MSTEPAAVIVVGTSAGGPSALKHLVAGLPADMAVAVLIVMHVGRRESILPQILSPCSSLPVRHAVDGEALYAGTILVAPPDRHLLVESGKVRLSGGAKENHARPAIDPLFRTAAQAYGPRVIGVILTGNLDDGTLGLQAVKAHGGIGIVQDPVEADVPTMPQSALDHVDVDYCLPLDGIAGTLIKVVREIEKTGQYEGPTSDFRVTQMKDRYLTGLPDMAELDKIGERSKFTCPECHGVLWEIRNGEPHQFRCHTGHAFTALALAEAQDQATEEALWGALRALHEKRTLMERFAEKADQNKRPEAAADYRKVAEQAARHSEMLRKLIGEQ